MTKRVLDFSKESGMTVNHDERCVMKDIHPENIFTFEKGVLGFENQKKYIFLLNEKLAPFIFMQAIDKPDMNFVCVESFLINPEYSFNLSDRTVKELALEKTTDLLVLSIVTVRKNVEDITANLLSPLLVNMKNSKAVQQVLDDSETYPVRYNIWDAIKSSAAVMAG